MSHSVISVHHFVASLTIRQYGSSPTSDLLGVDYWFTYPSNVELPIRIGRIDLFTRFYLSNARSSLFSIEIWWNDPSGYVRDRMGVFGPFPMAFTPGQTVADGAFRLNNVILSRHGVYTIRLLRRRRHRWQGEKWSVVRETHFCLVRT
jgi:hypothetical protein